MQWKVQNKKKHFLLKINENKNRILSLEDEKKDADKNVITKVGAARVAAAAVAQVKAAGAGEIVASAESQAIKKEKEVKAE